MAFVALDLTAKYISRHVPRSEDVVASSALQATENMLTFLELQVVLLTTVVAPPCAVIAIAAKRLQSRMLGSIDGHYLLATVHISLRGFSCGTTCMPTDEDLNMNRVAKASQQGRHSVLVSEEMGFGRFDEKLFNSCSLELQVVVTLAFFLA